MKFLAVFCMLSMMAFSQEKPKEKSKPRLPDYVVAYGAGESIFVPHNGRWDNEQPKETKPPQKKNKQKNRVSGK